MADFDAIVVGAGCAGSVAAYELAKAGKEVLLIERGNFAGAKNMTGGRIYAHSLRKVFPDFESEAPLERKIARERISLMTQEANLTMDFTSEAMRAEDNVSYSVLRAPFDQWLAGKAEAAGAETIYGIPVESLVKDASGKICGIRAGEDEISAEVVILCDGVNSLLANDAVGYDKPPASQVAVGVKEVFMLDEKTVSDRLLCADGEGAARAIDSGDTSKAGLQGYVDALESTFVMEDLRRYKDVPAFLENFDRMFGLYPQAAANVMDALFLIDGTPVEPLKSKLKPIIRKVGVMSALKDVRGALKAL